ncbi:3-deoxy-D-manno-octulosonic-acid transferase [Maribacter orientalis]|uniref:3-deoxy-D-manno-octulosonic acid transferase n=1 Tax=Maribacter orientalis TaxID=228957 RepID=A0A1H7R4B1_9FLAO|nr:glycosyltransferase N-terminal domain-containing protein [Maribacter orientalis]SEL54952.1 3-deoxy-D-manno-octulosonic-acid transferase [Maribacter orientalis]
MYFLYNLLVLTASAILRALALVNTKLSLFVNGRKETFSILKKTISKKDKVIWIHAASLGEYEQGLPIMEELRKTRPNHKLVLSFFSPSGYEVKKNSKTADVICYLPLDTRKNVSQFLKAVHPELVIFIKYEIWPNYLSSLKKENIPTFLISALFKESQIYFKWYGAFMRKALSKFTHFFVQNEKSYDLLNSIGFNNATIAGDTRFDRVNEILEKDNSLDFMSSFKQDKFCFVAGSTWPEDENIIIDYINQNTHPIQFVIAPHTMKAKHIESIKQAVHKPVLCYSELSDKDPTNYQVIIIDTIGILTKIYSYADVAYVGGGFATGLHNTLEPAVYGIPVIIGPKYDGFAEAEELVQLKGVLSIHSPSEFRKNMNLCFERVDYKEKTGQINYSYITSRKGATSKIMNVINLKIQS